MANWIKGAVAVVLLVLVAYVVVTIIPPRPDEDECGLLAKQQTATVNLEATIKDLDVLKARVGVAAGQVQEVDAILKDYGFKYATACRDNKRHVISDPEYNCRRDNMDRALSTARSLGLTLDAVKTIADPASQRDIVLKDIEIIKDLARTDFKSGCGSSLAVTPLSLTFEGLSPERTIQVVNSGNRNATYYVTDLPEAFVAVNLSDDINAGKSVVVAIKRAPFPIVPDKAVVFYVKDNFNNKVAVNITVDQNNSQLYTRLAAAAQSEKPTEHVVPTLEDVLASVTKALPQITDLASKHLLAAGTLKEIGNFAEVNRALQAISIEDASLYKAPSMQLLAGISAYQTNNNRLALEHFRLAANPSPGNDEGAETAAKLTSGALLLSQKDEKAAEKYLRDPEVRSRVLADRNFSDYLAAEFKVSELPKAAIAAGAIKQF